MENFDESQSDEEEDRLIDELMLDAQDFDEADEHKRMALENRTSITTVASDVAISKQHPAEPTNVSTPASRNYFTIAKPKGARVIFQDL